MEDMPLWKDLLLSAWLLVVFAGIIVTEITWPRCGCCGCRHARSYTPRVNAEPDGPPPAPRKR